MVKSACKIKAVCMCFNWAGLLGGETMTRPGELFFMTLALYIYSTL